MLDGFFGPGAQWFIQCIYHVDIGESHRDRLTVECVFGLFKHWSSLGVIVLGDAAGLHLVVWTLSGGSRLEEFPINRPTIRSGPRWCGVVGKQFGNHRLRRPPRSILGSATFKESREASAAMRLQGQLQQEEWQNPRPDRTTSTCGRSACNATFRPSEYHSYRPESP